ncbi:glycoside hydrolase family 2 protein [Halalkalibacterium halodurans]|uniref:glycoside hydrolase family 2 protein n=1 Tax=Halalkalibacterium halodurans TaxID=86665 RepID=UPI002E1FB970|nr:glycoside hydrolase family 2 protein [Halalkalibacterium halodurans]MED4084642.1 glycoside hydrolase family 2 protein [Halalkalibacterium halodurans]MED4103978.1 glycoside hydrolase family 2 protein [Halalkalibacterium halodurans]MED4108950.1 glycoside hydrolase family 2 protein [Halalkalibacterium halodurans]MED4125270.1 glycoside hydrolase family 2 protein [Halalkalibacterium halodurans]
MKTHSNVSWLRDVNVFAVNRLPAHSDHVYYETMEEAKKEPPMSMRHSLNGHWKFHYAINPNTRPKEFYQLGFDCKCWDDILVPGHIQLQGYGKPQYVNTMYPWDGHHHLRPPEIPENDNPIGSYVKYFDIPNNMSNHPLFISFQGVETAFYVWLNGEFVGYSEDSFTPAEFELTPYAVEGENKLCVEVYQRSTGSWLEDQDFWRFSGIFRDVYLYTIPNIHVYDMHVRAELDRSLQTGILETTLELKRSQEKEVMIVAELYDAEGAVVATADMKTNQDQATVSMSVDSPALWSAEDPYLYKLFLKLFDENGTLVEVVPQKIGFRRFELVNNIMTLNGKRIVFKGVNRHEFNGRTGRVVTKEDMLEDIKTMKKHNINAVRTSHYPNNSEWYQLCDEYGLYVIDEMNLETHGSWQKLGKVEPSWNIPGNHLEWEPIVMDRAVSMFERDKNHPSILIWSCGNESYAGEVILNVSRYFKSVDPSRLVHYEGVFHARAYDDTSDMESRMYAKPKDIEDYLTNDPKKPYISCEYMHAMGNSLGGMHKYTELEQKYPMYQGGFIWDYIDQALLKKDRYGKEYFAYGGDFGDRPTDYSFCANGIVYADRKPSPKMQEVKFLYQNIKLVPDREGVLVKNENLFTDTSAYQLEYVLYWEGTELYRKKQDVFVAPQEEVYLPFDWLEQGMNESGEYCIHTMLTLKQDQLWAEKGHEVAFGQHVYRMGAIQKERNARGALKVVHGDVNIGIHGEDFSVLFSKAVGSLVSLHYAGKEMIEQPPMPLFWRATTDNDKGCSQLYHSGIWYAASLARKCVNMEVEEKPGHVSVLFTYHFAISDRVEVKVGYTVFPDGSLRVRSTYQASKGGETLPQLPMFALSFKLPADYEQLEWYALGPEENYADRATGARLCTFKNKVEDSLSQYVTPQESGNRTGVRTVKILDANGQGIEVCSVEEPIECQISPYTAFELEQASHPYELPNVHYTVVNVAGKQMGVGGDDSWGAPVHDEYVLKADQDLEFVFDINRV